jgi:hypothetical protein
MNVMGDGFIRWIDAVRAEVRRVTFERSSYFRVAAGSQII